MKQYFNEMGDEQQSIAAGSSVKEQQQQQPDGVDVPVVQPSFDDHDGRSPGAERKSSEMGNTRSSPTTQRGEGHKRNLSEHFQDATTLSHRSSDAGQQKHRREYSGDVSNPAQAHRRIDSVGKSTSIQRGRPHRRIDSSGLDALTAAADFSREELQATSYRRHSWNQPSNLRRSPIETSSTYEHAGHGSGPVPHSSPHQPPPQLTAAAAHHRHYSSLSSSGGLPARPVYYSHPSYPQPPYPHTYHYPHHPQSHGYGHGPPPLHPAPPPGGYPVQYSRGHGQDPYNVKHHTPLQQPTLERPHIEIPAHRASPTISSIDHKQSTANPPAHHSSPSNEGMDPPAPPSWRRGGSTQGVQTYITGIGAGETTRTLEANPVAAQAPAARPGPAGGHHRKLSSFSNLGALLFGPTAQVDPSGSGGPHHRSTSSSISFLGALDVNLNESTDATFLRNLQESTGTPAAAYNPGLQVKAEPAAKQPPSVPTAVYSDSAKNDNESSNLMAGGTSKRVRRKCTILGCDNRVVQGGLCIAHGAKRKLCKHPGCSKHVKKAGLCSTHGPARKRCEVDDCSKVAVQAGRCIAHGAKKKLCSVGDCTKQAILSGMCKKHYDQNPIGEQPAVCTIIEPKKARPSKATKKPGHTRGLSIFQEISADAVGDLLSVDAAKNAAKKAATTNSTPSSSAKARPSNHHHRSTASQILVDIV